MTIPKSKKDAFIQRLKDLETFDIGLVAEEPDINLTFDEVEAEMKEDAAFQNRVDACFRRMGYKIWGGLAVHARGMGTGTAPNATISKLLIELCLPEVLGKSGIVKKEDSVTSPEDRKMLGLPVDEK